MVSDMNMYIIDFVEPWLCNKGKDRSDRLGLMYVFCMRDGGNITCSPRILKLSIS
jgi:hypothetical protein